MEATIRDLRLHSSKLLAATGRGESVVITYRGKRRAALNPWVGASDDQAAAGAIRRSVCGRMRKLASMTMFASCASINRCRDAG